MKRLMILLAVLTWANWLPPSFAKERKPLLLSPKIMQAKSVYIDCVCPRALAAARTRATQQLEDWGRFQLVEGPKGADLVFLFSANEYLGDYLTRDGPDKRPVMIESTIMTVIDARTGQGLWSDSRRWGSWRVDSATKDLISEFKELMASQVKRWTLNDLKMCAVAPIFKGFDHRPLEEALKSEGVTRVANKPDRLSIVSETAPEFCKNAELLVGPENRVVAFEVYASQQDDLNVDEVLQHADQFDFTGGKFANGDQVFFSAQSKDKKMLIEFEVQNHRSVLRSVSYYF